MAFNPKLATFSFFIFLIGSCLTYLLSLTHGKLSSKCISKQVQTGMNILLMLSTMMMIIPLIQLFCHWGCGCQQNDFTYKWIIVGISVLILVCSSVVLNGLKEDNCDNTGIKQLMIGLISTSAIIITAILLLPLIIPSLKGSFMSGKKDDYIPISSASVLPVAKNESGSITDIADIVEFE